MQVNITIQQKPIALTKPVLYSPEIKLVDGGDVGPIIKLDTPDHLIVVPMHSFINALSHEHLVYLATHRAVPTKLS